MNAPSRPLEDFLNQQGELKWSAVDEFSKQHELKIFSDVKIYQELIPTGLPGKGEQFAFEVDLDKCTGCKACVTGCHNLNGLDEAETWRDIGILIAPKAQVPYVQTITTACHHCASPGCLSGCPVKAYVKEEDTGVVKHLDDQCIGCQYCTWKCPYEVPKYNAKLGIVRKCDMCVGRLRAGEAPACVQACPSKAITIRIITKVEIQNRAQRKDFLITAPNALITQPSTRFVGKKQPPINSVQQERNQFVAKHAHWPLLLMLVITQSAIGLNWFALFVDSRVQTTFAIVAFALMNIGLGIGALHLGRPLYMFRGFLGWRTSWMSREIIAFTVLTGAIFHWAVAMFVPLAPEFVKQGTLIMSAVLCVPALLSSVMIYHDTHKPCWNFMYTFPRFVSTALLLGSLVSAIISSLYIQKFADWVIVSAVIFKVAVIVFEVLSKITKEENSPLFRSWEVQKNQYLLATLIQGITYSLTTIFVLNGNFFVALSFAVIAELSERYLFFKTEVAIKMPGSQS